MMAPQAARDKRDDRLDRLRAAVRDAGSLHLGEAARLLAVSAMTVRRDLGAGAPGLLLLGGHVVATAAAGTEAGAAPYLLDRERDSHREAKREAARRAARTVEAGDTVFLDCGTTVPHVIGALPPALELTVVCYALNVAQLACARPRTRVVLLGGVFYPESATFMSDEAVRAVGRLGINRAFLSAGGLHDTFGASCSHFHEVPIKRAVLARALRRILVIDESKRGAVRPARFAGADAFDAIVTEAGVTDVRVTGAGVTAPD